MSFFEHSLVGKQIDGVHIDSEVTYIMLSDGTQVTIRGLVVVEPGRNLLNPVDTIQIPPPLRRAS
jgi:hypothetical protein